MVSAVAVFTSILALSKTATSTIPVWRDPNSKPDPCNDPPPAPAPARGGYVPARIYVRSAHRLSNLWTQWVLGVTGQNNEYAGGEGFRLQDAMEQCAVAMRQWRFRQAPSASYTWIAAFELDREDADCICDFILDFYEDNENNEDYQRCRQHAAAL